MRDRRGTEKGALLPVIGTRAPDASWCHPISSAQGAPFAPLVRKGSRARLRARCWRRPSRAGPWSPFSRGGPSLSGGEPGSLRRRGGEYGYPISEKKKSQGQLHIGYTIQDIKDGNYCISSNKKEVVAIRAASVIMQCKDHTKNPHRNKKYTKGQPHLIRP